ncbi:hypothetical protein LPB140_02880 [Sphingorhabdus lutea]|uniref:Uncharacterized protein n=1 Tax=Sphingorhabdus lutea TaxID=1913578 RepID=A0A1L3J9Z5_9SPHN|nr:hypothetical protein LPB140_02880 [Sphingorhabdus lutea]
MLIYHRRECKDVVQILFPYGDNGILIGKFIYFYQKLPNYLCMMKIITSKLDMYNHVKCLPLWAL